MERIWPPLKWLPAVLLGGIIPIVVFWITLTWGRDFSAEPPWAWAIIPLLPLASITLLFLPADRLTLAIRLGLLIFALHAAIMIGLMLQWPSVAGTAFFVDILFIATLLSAEMAGGRPGRLAKATILSLVILFGMAFPLALANGIVVTWRAEALAGERPYCIQYASQTDAFAYEPARTLFDLSFLKMQARLMEGGSSLFHFQNHAVLIVDDGTRSFFNWSYGQEAFLDEVLNRNSNNKPQVFCHPEQHFAKHLPIWQHEPTQIKMSIYDRHFLIPETYRPRAISDKIIINAVPLDFAPYDISNKQQPHIAQFYYDVVVASVGSMDLSAELKQRLEGRDTKAAEPEFGLSKTHLYIGKVTQQPDRRAFVGLYAGYDSAGHVTELIECDRKGLDTRLPTCRYQFVADGLIFRLTIGDPSQWQAIERRLAEIFASFEQRQVH